MPNFQMLWLSGPVGDGSVYHNDYLIVIFKNSISVV